jgi:hypothetical protein
MAGLLDFNNPEMRMGLGLLALGQMPKAQGFQGLMGLLASQDMAEDRKADREYRNAQIADLQRKATLAQQKQEMLTGLLGSPLAGVTTGGGIDAPTGRAAAGLQNMSIDQIAALKANGIDVSDLWKTAREGFKRDAGAYYEDVNRNVQYMPKLDNGMIVSGGQVMQAPGYAQANAGIKGAEAGAVEAAKFPFAVGQDRARQNLAAELEPIKTWNPQTGREEYTPRAAVARPQAQYSGPGYNGGSAAEAAKEQLFIMQREYDKLPPGPDRDAVAREMQRLGGAPGASGSYAAGPSAAEQAANEAARTRAVDTAKADVVRDTGRKSEAKLANKLTTGVDRALDLLNQGPTASVMGSLADKGIGAFGYSTKGGETAAQLEALSGWLVSNVPRMEGPQSNIDVQNYQTMAGRIGDRNLPIGVRKAAAEEVKRLQDKYAELNGGAPQADKPAKTVVKTGMYGGRKVVQYSDGTVDYAN